MAPVALRRGLWRVSSIMALCGHAPVDDASRRSPHPGLPREPAPQEEWPEDDPAYQQAPLLREDIRFPDAFGRQCRGYLSAHKAAMEKTVKGVIICSDVFGYRTDATRAVADRIASSCEAVVVVPDLFRERPWPAGDAPSGNTYERWRDQYTPADFAGTVEGAQVFLNTAHGVELVGLLGFCFGAGRALEALAQEAVQAHAAVAFYPTRYDVRRAGSCVSVPLLAVFGDRDRIPGATPADAKVLETALASNSRVRSDYYVSVFRGQGHAFAHDPADESALRDADDALKLMEAWFDKWLDASLLAARDS